MFNHDFCKTVAKSRGFRNYQLAKQVGITENHMSKILNGHANPSMKLVRKLSTVLSVSCHELDDRFDENLDDNTVVSSLTFDTNISSEDLAKSVIMSDEEAEEAINRLSSLDSDDIISNQYILDALNVLKYTCTKYRDDGCHNCPLKRRDGNCGVKVSEPCNYNTVTSTHWTAFRV